MKELTFEQLPSAVSLILEKLENIEARLAVLEKPLPKDQDVWMNVDELMEYHPDKPSKKTIYDWVTLRKVPYHKDGKRLRFLKSEIDKWLMGSYHKTEEEMYEESINFVNSKRLGRR